jgi:hypothetical protein
MENDHVQIPTNQVQPQVVENTQHKQVPIMKEFPKSDSKSKLYIILGSILVVLLGIGTGYFLSGNVSGQVTTAPSGAAPGAQNEAMEAGVDDTTAFPDEVEGMLKEGGIEGEGTHYLDRNAGENKNVYLTSTVIDLQSFVGKNVKVWGETMSAKHAPWLMDVGKIKVIE